MRPPGDVSLSVHMLWTTKQLQAHTKSYSGFTLPRGVTPSVVSASCLSKINTVHSGEAWRWRAATSLPALCFDAGSEIVIPCKVHLFSLESPPVPKRLVKHNEQAAGNKVCHRFSGCCHPHSAVPDAAQERAEDPSCSQFASICLWLLASVHEREIYIDLSGCLRCSGQKVDRRCFTKEIKEPDQATRRTLEHKNTELEQHTGCTQLNKYDCCIDNVSECHYHCDRQHSSFPFSTVLEYQRALTAGHPKPSICFIFLCSASSVWLVGVNCPFKAL